MPRKRQLLDVSVGLTGPDVHNLDEIVRATGSTRTDVIRFAIREFVENFGKQPEKEYESILEARLCKIENRLANLTVLSVRASAQTLYYVTLPYSRGGLPTRPLKEEVFEAQWQRSRKFAGEFLKHAIVDVISSVSQTEPRTNGESALN